MILIKEISKVTINSTKKDILKKNQQYWNVGSKKVVFLIPLGRPDLFGYILKFPTKFIIFFTARSVSRQALVKKNVVC